MSVAFRSKGSSRCGKDGFQMIDPTQKRDAWRTYGEHFFGEVKRTFPGRHKLDPNKESEQKLVFPTQSWKVSHWLPRRSWPCLTRLSNKSGLCHNLVIHLLYPSIHPTINKSINLSIKQIKQSSHQPIKPSTTLVLH